MAKRKIDPEDRSPGLRWYYRNREAALAKRAIWAKKNKERIKENRDDWNLRNPGKAAAKQRNWTKRRRETKGTNMLHRLFFLWKSAKARASKKGIPFALDKAKLVEILGRGVCQVTGLPLNMTDDDSPWAPSLDRIDSNLGYTEENVQVVAWLYNAAKWQYSHREVLVLSEAVVSTTKVPYWDKW